MYVCVCIIEDLVFLSLNLPLLSDKQLEEGAKRARLDTIEEEDFLKFIVILYCIDIYIENTCIIDIFPV